MKSSSNAKRLLAVILTVVLCIGTTSGAIGIANAAGSATAGVSTDTDSSVKTVAASATGATADKDETVYVIAAADGSAKQIIVSDWLKNPDGDNTLTDYTELQDVENVKGDETYSIDADNMRIWDAGGNDIYYQGTTDKSLPVDVTISYRLDGKTVTADELAGKSGAVTIRFDYTSNEKQSVTIDGKTETISVPFVMLSGMILNNDSFTNINVTNGKIINDGDRSIVMGFALPGLQEDLGLSSDDFGIPSYIEVTADVTNFTLATTMTVATNEVFNELELDDVSSLDDLTSSLTELTDASQQLVDGSSALYEGLTTLLDKSDELISGIDQLYAGAKDLSDGADTLKSGSDSLSAGLSSLSSGLGTLTENNDDLISGAKQVFETLLSTADTQLAASGLSVPKLTIENYKTTLNGVVSSLDSNSVYNMAYNTALSRVTAAVNAEESTIRAAVTAAAEDKVLEGVLAAAGQTMTAAQYDEAVTAGQIASEMQSQISANVSTQMASDAVKAQIETGVQTKIQELIDTNMQSADVQSQITAAVAQAQSGASSINALITQLDSYNTFYQGLISYTSGVNQAYSGSKQLLAGAGQLSGGAGELSGGASSLYTGLGSLKDGSAALVDGVSQLAEGSMQLSEGMKQFNDEGIQRIADAFDGDLSGLLARLQAISDVSKSYQSFGGIADGASGSVKFIYRTDAIE